MLIICVCDVSHGLQDATKEWQKNGRRRGGVSAICLPFLGLDNPCQGVDDGAWWWSDIHAPNLPQYTSMRHPCAKSPLPRVHRYACNTRTCNHAPDPSATDGEAANPGPPCIHGNPIRFVPLAIAGFLFLTVRRWNPSLAKVCWHLPTTPCPSFWTLPRMSPSGIFQIAILPTTKKDIGMLTPASGIDLAWVIISVLTKALS